MGSLLMKLGTDMAVPDGQLGTVSAEHGIGKIKTEFLKLMYGDEGIREMRKLKQLFDPCGLLNPGNLFQ